VGHVQLRRVAGDTAYDPIWQVTLCGCEMDSIEERYTSLTFIAYVTGITTGEGYQHDVLSFFYSRYSAIISSECMRLHRGH